MELNSIFRRTGEPSYTTPLAVLGSVGDQNGGGYNRNDKPTISKSAAYMAQGLVKEVPHWSVISLRLELSNEETTNTRLDVSGFCERPRYQKQDEVVRTTGWILPYLRTTIRVRSTGIASHSATLAIS